jgi:hypothetical protein
MLYQFAQHLLLRMPVKNPADYDANPQSFLNDHFFRAAIRVATSTFYIMLERKDFQAGSLTEKEANTLQKYINRYCFRPTPFGLFSSVTLSNWSAVNIPDTNRPFIAHFRAAIVYFGETDHPIPWQTDHLNCWRKDAANAVEAFTKIVI